jgi:predicted dehydrogenase
MVDLVLWLTEKKVISVVAMGNKLCSSNTKFQGNDFISALIQFDDSSIGKVTANFGCVRPHFHNVRVFGTKGTILHVDEKAVKHYASRSPNTEPLILSAPYPGVEKGAFLSDFINRVRKVPGSELIKADEIFDALSICFAIDRSCSTGQVEQVRYI